MIQLLIEKNDCELHRRIGYEDAENEEVFASDCSCLRFGCFDSALYSGESGLQSQGGRYLSRLENQN